MSALSVGDIYNIFSNYNLNKENSVLKLEALRELNFDLKRIFKERISVILFLTNPDPSNPIGHYVLLSWLKDDLLEYFDSFANKPPNDVLELAKINEMKLRISTKKLQDDSSNYCGKYCVLRMKSIPSHLEDFQNSLLYNTKMTPDEIVNTMVKSLYKK